MSDYFNLKFDSLLNNPPENQDLGSTQSPYSNVYVDNALVVSNTALSLNELVTPKIISIVYPGNDTAADIAGGQTIQLTGSGFTAGAIVKIDGTTVGAVSVVSSSVITFISPVKSAGSYTLHVISADGGTATYFPGIDYSGVPSWTTASGSLANIYETQSFNSVVTATGNDTPITYSVASGTLPPGASLNSSNGAITGTSQLTANSTTYTFTIAASDAQNQDTNRSFSIRVDPDLITWSSPNVGQNGIYEYTAISNLSLSANSLLNAQVVYSGNSLPSGLSVTGNTLSGNINVAAGNIAVNLLATTTTTSGSNNKTIYFNTDPDVVTWSSPSNATVITAYEGANIPNTSLSASSIVGNLLGTGITFSGANLPNGVNVSGNTLFGISNTVANTAVTLIATANTTSRTANNIVYLNILQDSVTFTSPFAGELFDVAANTAIANISLSATALSNTALTYTATGLPTGLSISGSNIVGTSTTVGVANATISAKNSNTQVTINTDVAADANFRRNATVLRGHQVPHRNWLYDQTVTDNPGVYYSISSPEFTGTALPTKFHPFLNTYSAYFDGTGDYLTLSSNDSMNFSTNNFTIEGWFYTGNKTQSVSASRTIIGNGGNSYAMQLYIDTSGHLVFGNTGGTFIKGSTDLANNQWHHFAISRNGTGTNQIGMWVDGVRVAQGTNATNYVSSTIYVGSVDTANGYWDGYISNLRIVKGSSVYDPANSTITVPTSKLTNITNTALLICQSNRFIDASSNAYTVTKYNETAISSFIPFTLSETIYGSAYFNGSSAISHSNVASRVVAAADSFTLELWAYKSSTSTAINGIYNAQQNGWGIYVKNGNLHFGTYNFGSTAFVAEYDTGLAFPNYQWNHVIVTYTSNTLRYFVNGVLSATTTSNPTFVLASGHKSVTGRGATTSQFFTGYISNVKFTRGTTSASALYSTNYTVPSSPKLTYDANTRLLTHTYCQSDDNSKPVDNSGLVNLITYNGNAREGALNPFTKKGWSYHFDGVDDYISIAESVGLRPESNPFTIEAWIYRRVTGVAHTIFCKGATTPTGFVLQVTATDVLRYTDTNTNLDSATTIPAHTWTHVAVVRESTSSNGTKLYIGGVLSATGTSATNFNQTDEIRIGTNRGATEDFDGFISNLRYSLRAVYTTGFTPSTVPLSGDGSRLLTCNSGSIVDFGPANWPIVKYNNLIPAAFSPFNSHTFVPKQGSLVGRLNGARFTSSTVIPATSNFTLEFWYYRTSDSSGFSAFVFNQLEGTGFNRVKVMVNTLGNLFVAIENTMFGDNVYVANNVEVPGTKFDAWHHFAWTRVGNNPSAFSVYVDGTRVNHQATVNGNIVIGDGIISILDSIGGSSASPMLISDLRVVVGSAVYTGTSYTVPTAPLTSISGTVLLTAQGTTDELTNYASTRTFTVTGQASGSYLSPYGVTSELYPQIYNPANEIGTYFFDGTGDFLNTSDIPQLDLGTGDYTIESWIYRMDTGVQRAIIDTRGQAGVGVCLHITTGNKLAILDNSSTYITGATNVPDNQWVHVAATRKSGTTKVFVNGVQDASISSDTRNNVTGAGGIYIGRQFGSTSNDWNGYITAARIIKSKALYTHSFIPRNEPYGAEPGTVLLLNGNNARVIDYSRAMVLGATTQPTITTDRPIISARPVGSGSSNFVKYNAESIIFGKGLLGSGPVPQLAVGTGDFTIELWYRVYCDFANNNAVSGNFLFTSNTVGGITGSNAVGIRFGAGNGSSSFIDNGDGLYCKINGTHFGVDGVFSAADANLWTHLALTRQGTTLRLFKNGNVVGSTTNSGNIQAIYAGFGASWNDWSGNPQGAFDDLRFTAGLARYTGNFTPPTSTIPRI